MKWSEIDSAFGDLKENLGDVGTRIETAIRHHGQIYHANHRPWYTKKIRVIQRRFLVLKRRLAKLSDFPMVFEKLEAELRILAVATNDTSILSKAYAMATSYVKSLKWKIRRRQQQEFDVFATDRGELSIDRKLCFVMMPFNPEKVFSPVAAVIRKAVKAKGLRYVRSDNVFDTRAVILDIWDNIRKSRVCIADASPPRNANVFYEVGMAHALPKRVILISRKSEPDDEKFPFDVSHVRCIFYEKSASGYRQLEQKISRTLRTVLR